MARSHGRMRSPAIPRNVRRRLPGTGARTSTNGGAPPTFSSFAHVPRQAWSIKFSGNTLNGKASTRIVMPSVVGSPRQYLVKKFRLVAG